MAYSRDTDLQKMLPHIFTFGIDSFAEYHQPAADEVARDIRREFIPRQSTLTASGFDPDMLDDEQMRRAACLRVLAWHILPRLAMEQPVRTSTAESKSINGTEAPGTITTTISAEVTRNDLTNGYTENTSSNEQNAQAETASTENAEATKEVTTTFNFAGASRLYANLYKEELRAVIEDGILYSTESGVARIYPRPLSESKRMRR